jgi:hypothetical protein
VAEAAAVRVPTLVRRLPSFADVPVELTIDDQDLAAAVAVLDDPATAAANVAGWAAVLARNTVADQRLALSEVYSASTSDHRARGIAVPATGSAASA